MELKKETKSMEIKEFFESVNIYFFCYFLDHFLLLSSSGKLTFLQKVNALGFQQENYYGEQVYMLPIFGIDFGRYIFPKKLSYSYSCNKKA